MSRLSTSRSVLYFELIFVVVESALATVPHRVDLAADAEERAAAALQTRISKTVAAREAREALEDLLPRATGREAKVEARIARREDRLAREASPDVAALPGGGDAFGAGASDSFQSALARQRAADAARAARRARGGGGHGGRGGGGIGAERLLQLQEAEEARNAHFRSILAAASSSAAGRVGSNNGAGRMFIPKRDNPPAAAAPGGERG